MTPGSIHEIHEERLDDASRALLARVREQLPLLREEAPKSEAARAPTDRAIEALASTGVFSMMVPKSYGGLELDLDAFLAVGLTLGEADVSLAWITTFYIEHNWMLCQFPAKFQEQLYEDRSYVLAPAIIAPTGSAEQCNGGWRLSGRWRFGTGIVHGDWVILGGLTPETGGLRFFAMPKSDVEVVDTWHVDGMRGTGSHDVVVEDRLIPEERSIDFGTSVLGQGLGAELHAGPLYRTPMIPILAMAASMPIVGQSRAIVRDHVGHVKEKSRMGVGPKVMDKSATQVRIARTELGQRQIELAMHDVVGRVMARRDAASPEDRAMATTTLCLSVHQARELIAEIAVTGGASAHYEPHPLQRALRDVHMATSHVVFDRDAQLENLGRLRLGLEPTSFLY